MATLLQQIENLKKLDEQKIEKQLFIAIKKVEGKFIKDNKLQLTKGKNVEDEIVGTYALSTQGYANAEGIYAPKKFGEPYNFTWSENFFGGFKLALGNEHVTLFSTGIGNGDKKEFLTTNNLFGLSDENLKIRIREDILPFINKFARVTLNI